MSRNVEPGTGTIEITYIGRYAGAEPVHFRYELPEDYEAFIDDWRSLDDDEDVLEYLLARGFDEYTNRRRS